MPSQRKIVGAIVAAAGAGGMTLSSASAQTLVLGGIDPATGHLYYASDVPVSFSSGRTLAADLSVTLGQTAYMASINTPEEQQFINSVVGFVNVHWIGLTAEGDPGGPTYLWESGEAVTYTNWSGGAPVLEDPLRNYASMNWDSNGGWLNLNENGAPFGFKFALVEVVPAPGAGVVLGLGALVASGRRQRGR